MTEVITIGVDLAKNVFQVHGVDVAGGVVFRRQLRRGQMLPFFKKQRPCLVGMEACATSHHWGRELRALGHQVRLMPPRYVKPYVKRNKNDMADAEAICEAVTRPPADLVTRDGRPLPERLAREIAREIERLALLQVQLREIEHERDQGPTPCAATERKRH
jgi:transposase